MEGNKEELLYYERNYSVPAGFLLAPVLCSYPGGL